MVLSTRRMRFGAVSVILPPEACAAEVVTVLPFKVRSVADTSVMSPALPAPRDSVEVLLLEILAPFDKAKLPALSVMVPPAPDPLVSAVMAPPLMVIVGAFKVTVPPIPDSATAVEIVECNREREVDAGIVIFPLLP